MSTATHMTTWMRTWTNDEGVTKDYELPVDVSCYGPGTTLWRLDPPLDGHEYVVICDRGKLLDLPPLVGEPETVTETELIDLVDVFPANADGTLQSMSRLGDPISLKRPRDGIDIESVLRQLGYTEAT